MADQKVTELTALGDNAADEDLLHVVDDPSGTPLDRKATRKELVGPVYAEISVEGNATTTTFGGSSTDFTNKAQVTVFDTDNGPSNGATASAANDHITADKTVVCLVMATVSFSGGLSDGYSFAIFKNNGATKLTPRFTRKMGTGGDVGVAMCFGIVSLTATDTVELWAQNETDTSALTVQDATLTLIRVN